MNSDTQKVVKEIRREAKSLSGKTLLITGGSGFLGKYFLHTIQNLNKNILSKPCKVISLDNYITAIEDEGSTLYKDKNFIFIKHDVKNPVKIEGPVDFIIHAAGIASPVYYMKYPLETIDVATQGTRNMLELARKKRVESFLFFSSSEIYGDPDPNFVPTPETYPGNVSCIGPRACYDESKRLGETLCMTYFDVYQVPVKIVRPFNVYGPGMRADDYRVVPRFLTSALKKEPLPVHVGGNHTRTFCYITDAITGFFKVLLSEKNGEVYNVGNSNDEVNMMALAQMVSDLFKNKIEVKSVEYPPSYPQSATKRRCPDTTKISILLGYKPKVNLQDGLKKTLKWYKKEIRK